MAGEAKPCCWPLLSPKIRAPSEAVTSEAPARSRCCPPAGRCAGSRPTSNNIDGNHRRVDQEYGAPAEVLVKAAAHDDPGGGAAHQVVACHMASPRLRAGPSGFVVVRSERAAGNTMAPAPPWTSRAMMSMKDHCANPQATEATPNSANPNTRRRRRPAGQPGGRRPGATNQR